MKKRYISLGEIEAIIELYTFVNDEWGGNKIASWEYGQNLEVDGITKAAQAILQRIKEF